MKTFPSTRAVKVSEGQTYTGTFFITSFCPKAKPACKLVAPLYVSLVLHSAASSGRLCPTTGTQPSALQTKMKTKQALKKLVEMLQVVSVLLFFLMTVPFSSFLRPFFFDRHGFIFERAAIFK